MRMEELYHIGVPWFTTISMGEFSAIGRGSLDLVFVARNRHSFSWKSFIVEV